MKKPKTIFCLLTIFCLVLMFAGCGGGGGSGSGYPLSPEELEVATAVEAFAAAVKAESLKTAMSYVFSNLKYFSSTKATGYTQFQDRLEIFFTKATVNDCAISNIGVSMGGEDSASVIGQLTLVYSIDGTVATLSESLDLSLEKDSGKWGLTLFAGRNTLLTTAFPPAL